MLKLIEEEFYAQPEKLLKFSDHSIDPVPEGSLFVGAGDSYIAAQCSSALSSRVLHVLDPYELITSPYKARSRTVVFVSVSGKTRSNIVAAGKVRRFAHETIAVTASPNSSLAGATERTILIPYSYKPRVPGVLSFSLSLLACLKLVSSEANADYRLMLNECKEDASRIIFSGKGTTYFLGNGPSRWVSAYAAAKAYELFGAVAQASMLEGFSHMELFSLKKTDTVNIYSAFDPRRLGAQLASSLEHAGYKAVYLSFGRKSPVNALFYSIFSTQLAMIKRAKASQHKVPFFLYAKEKLKISDSMIY